MSAFRLCSILCIEHLDNADSSAACLKNIVGYVMTYPKMLISMSSTVTSWIIKHWLCFMKKKPTPCAYIPLKENLHLFEFWNTYQNMISKNIRFQREADCHYELAGRYCLHNGFLCKFSRYKRRKCGIINWMV